MFCCRRRNQRIALTTLAVLVVIVGGHIGSVFLWLFVFDWEPYLLTPSDLAWAEHNNNSTAYRIPAIIHQTYKDETSMPLNWKRARQSCMGLHPDYRFILWTDDKARDFIAEHYPDHLENYDSYPFNIQRIDALRYYIMHKMGGIYIDLDIGCRKRLDPLRNYPAVFPQTEPFGVSNDMFMAEPAHPILAQLIDRLPATNFYFGTKYPTVMFSTGPAFVDLQLMNFIASRRISRDAREGFDTTPATRSIKILNHYGESGSFFYHVAGSSWHSDDAEFVLWIFNHGVALCVLSVVMVVVLALLDWWRRIRRRRRQRSEQSSYSTEE